MGYQIIRFLIRIGFLTFFQKFYFINKKAIPKDGPIIFAANHPTAFLEPMIHAPFMKQISYFILRGDYFKAKWADKVLRNLNIVPIFRQRDGIENLRKNQELFGFFQDLLHEKKNITIMVEGSHDHHKRLRKVQRGTARMTLGTYKQYGDEDITVLPMGVNFTDVHSLRSMVMIKFGEPIILKDYLEQYRQNERKAFLRMTADIENRLLPCMVHIKNAEDDEAVNQLLDINRNSTVVGLWFPYSSNDTLLEREIDLARQVNAMEEAEKADFKAKMKVYQNTLAEHKIKDVGIGKSKDFNLLNTVLLLLGFPIFLFGSLLHLPLYFLVQKARNMVKKVEFKVSLGFAAMIFGYPIYWILWLIAALVTWHSYLFVWLGVMPFLAFFTLVYWDKLRYWNAARRFRSLKKEKKAALQKQRSAILDSF